MITHQIEMENEIFSSWFHVSPECVSGYFTFMRRACNASKDNMNESPIARGNVLLSRGPYQLYSQYKIDAFQTA